MQIVAGDVKISVWFEDVIGIDEDYFIPRFEKVLVKGKLAEWSFMGTAFDCCLILSYSSLGDLTEYIDRDLKALAGVVNKNMRRLLSRTEHNERQIMNVTCQMGTIIDNWIQGKEKDEKSKGNAGVLY